MHKQEQLSLDRVAIINFTKMSKISFTQMTTLLLKNQRKIVNNLPCEARRPCRHNLFISGTFILLKLIRKNNQIPQI